MGSSSSTHKKSRGLITYSQSIQRCNPNEIEHFKRGWDLVSMKNPQGKNLLDKQTFLRVVLGKQVPSHIASQIFRVFDQGDKSFLTYQEYICAMTILAKATSEEKQTLLFKIYDNSHNNKITREDMASILKEDIREKKTTQLITDKVESCFSSYDIENRGFLDSGSLLKWAQDNQKDTVLLDWIFGERSFAPEMCAFQNKNVDKVDNSISSKLDKSYRSSVIRSTKEIHSFTNLTTKEVNTLNDIHKKIVEQYGRVDKHGFSQLFSKQIPKKLVDALFQFFDENLDGFLDSREFIIGFSYLCRPSSEKEQAEFWFYLINQEQQQTLSHDDMSVLTEIMAEFKLMKPNDDIIKRQNSIIAFSNQTIDSLYNELKLEQTDGLSLEQFSKWMRNSEEALALLDELNRMSQLILGLLPIEPEEEKNTIKSIMEKHKTLKDGDNVYIISLSWWNKWKSSCGYDSDSAPSSRSRVVPIQNMPIAVKRNGFVLRGKLIINRDIICVPEDVWNALWKWYGGGPSFLRHVITGENNNVEIELYPYTFIVLLRRTKLSSLPSKKIEVAASKSPLFTLQHLKERACEAMKITDLSRIRIWNAKVLSRPVLIEDLSKSPAQSGLVDRQSIIFEMSNEDGEWPLDSEEESSSNPGLVGLKNLGNTCFMNSAIQCLSNTSPLTDYFLRNYHLRELNKTNPIGYHGNVARGFGKTVKKLWIPNSNGKLPSIYNPTSFQKVIARCNGTLGDGQQHDAQEFLTFLMNGLHEDLNRIKNKKYEANPEGDMSDEVKAKLFWEAYLRRNQSIIVDLFQGQFRSSLTCQHCSYSSVTFEPFTFLQLPLPLEKTRVFHIILHSLNKENPPMRYAVSIISSGYCNFLRSKLSELSGIPSKELLLVEIGNQYIRRYLKNSISVNSIANDVLHAFQIPIQVKMQKKKKKKKKNGEDNDLNNEKEKKKEIKDIGYAHVRIVLRYLSEQSVYFMIPRRVVLFGNPVVISVPSNSTVKQFKQLILEAFGDSLHFNNEPNLDDLPFKLSVTSNSGEGCGLCSWNEFCTGCSLEEKHMESLSNDTTIALDFDIQSTSMYNATTSEAIVNHESVGIEDSKREQPISLDDCLEWFTEEERLDDKEAWYCPQCKEHKPAIKKLDIWKLPKVIIIQLKRFHFRGRFVKISKLVNFPIENLDLSSSVMSPDDPPETYNLFAVLNHFGGLKGGHYTTYAANREDKQWYCFNDSKVFECDKDGIVTPAAYVLFYGTKNLQDTELLEPENKEEDTERTHGPCPLM